MQIGDRVIITGNHPWAGETGTYIRDDQTVFGIKPRVALDNGIECLVMNGTWKKAK